MAVAEGGADDDRPVVLTTFTVLADIAQNVAGDRLRGESITKIGAEVHGYEPSPRDVATASEADLILDNGLGLEAWFGQFVESVDVTHVVASDGVDAVDITGDSYAGKPNPHAWMSRSEEHTSELQSLMRIQYAVFCLKKKIYTKIQ